MILLGYEKNTDLESEYDVTSKDNKELIEMKVSISKHQGKCVRGGGERGLWPRLSADKMPYDNEHTNKGRCRDLNKSKNEQLSQTFPS